MPDSKHLRWVDDYSTDDESKPAITDGSVPSAEPAANDAVESAANDSDGWQQYRKWISKAPAPRGRRAGIDPALYSWKGYRNWSEQVKRNWDPDAGDDSE